MLEFVEGRRRGPRACPSQFVPDPVHHGLPEVRLEGALTARLEAPDPPKHIEEGVLNKILRVARMPGPLGQPAAGPALEGLQIPGEQRLEGQCVAGVRALEKLDRGVGGS